MRNALALTLLPLLVVACERYPADRDTKETGHIKVTTSALELPGINEACYKLEVKNGAGEVLWSEGTVCSSRYGDGRGSIAYVGSCDAVNNPNEVSLVLDSLADASGAPVSDFTNPCPADAPCTQKVVCMENADTPVNFDLTVMRNGHQGFLDVAVSIEDVACSAKLDCVDQFLTDPETGERKPTTVLAFACTAGDSSKALRMSDVRIDCDSPNGPVSIAIDPSQGPGNYYSQHHGDPHVDQAASWRTASSSSMTWSVGIAPNLEALDAEGVTGCVLHAQATATEDASVDWSPRTNYPYVDWSVPIAKKSANGPLALDCGNHALGAPDSGVSAKMMSKGKEFKGHVTLMK